VPTLPATTCHSAFLGAGWSFPPAFSSAPSGVELVSDLADSFERLHILLSTAAGFGCSSLGGASTSVSSAALFEATALQLCFVSLPNTR
jgi:hypothetical protein